MIKLNFLRVETNVDLEIKYIKTLFNSRKINLQDQKNVRFLTSRNSIAFLSVPALDNRR